MMRKIAKLKAHLKWIIPLVIYFVALGVIVHSYRNSEYERSVLAKETEITFTLGIELEKVDLSIDNATATLIASSKAMSVFNMEYNKGKVEQVLKNFVDTTDVSSAYVCDIHGNGYDYRGKEIYVGDEDYFDEIVSEYSRGGLGIVLAEEPVQGQGTTLLLVSSTTFDRGQQGFIVGTMSISSMPEQLFSERFLIDRAAIISIAGKVISYEHGPEELTGEAADVPFWDNVPPGITKDNIKISVSQKNYYMEEVPGYGYAIVIPMVKAKAGLVVLVRYEDMHEMLSQEMAPLLTFTIQMIVASLIFLILGILSYVIGGRIEAELLKRRHSKLERDVKTGLLTKESTLTEINSYIDNAKDPRALLFVVELDAKSSGSVERGAAFADAGIKEFVQTLEAGFRATDIIGKLDEDRFLIFLKDIHEDKDVRKQTDSMQMLLHDIRSLDAQMQVTAYAGAALYPDAGKSAREVISVAEAALKTAREAGTGGLSF